MLPEKDRSGLETDTFDDEAVDRDGLAAKQDRTPQNGSPREDGQDSTKATVVELSDRRKSVGVAGQTGRLTSLSTPDLNRPSTHLTPDTRLSSHSHGSSGTGGEEEEEDDDDDDDVPLGILAAHGFPNKHKAASRLDLSTPPPLNRRGSMPLTAPPVSVYGGESRAGGGGGVGPRGNLPVFARNLPQDPYYGAAGMGDQLAMNSGSALGGLRAGQVHPSGLVGVIAGEEQARAMRRGTSNQQPNNDHFMAGPHPGMMARSSTMGANGLAINGHPGMGGMGMLPPGPLSPGDHGQMQMAQQMNQIMQMQMQWMQQITQMQQQQQQNGGPPMSPMPQPPTPAMMSQNPYLAGMAMPGMDPANPNNNNSNINNQPRPFSMPLPEYSGPTGRAMSLTPGPNDQWNRNSSYTPSMNGAGGAGYAPSLAPSERSVVGLASRYRPVSVAAEPIKTSTITGSRPENSRAATFSAGMPPSSSPSPASLHPHPLSWGSTAPRNGRRSDEPQQAPRLSPTNHYNHNQNKSPTNNTTTTITARGPSPATSGPTSASAKSTKSNTPDEDDDDQGWAEMKRKRDRKKSAWRVRRRGRQAQIDDLVVG